MSNQGNQEEDVPLCPHCGTKNLVISQKAGGASCWECGGEIPDDFPPKDIWEFTPEPYGWKRRKPKDTPPC